MSAGADSEGASRTWRASLEPPERTEVSALLDAATDSDGVAPVSEEAALRLAAADRPGLRHVLARDDDGRLAGYAQLDTSAGELGRAELVVHPGHRRRGVGEALLSALLGSVDHLQVWAHGDHPGAGRLAEKLGLVTARALWQLRRGLREELPDIALPEGVRLRPFVVGPDDTELLRVNNAAFAWHPEQGGWGPEQLQARQAEPWFDPEGLLLAVAVADDRLLGFHWTKVHPAGSDQGPEPVGEVYVLGVDPAARGRSLGGALTLAGLHHLRERGLDTVLLYVEADNDAANRVYRDLGFEHWHTDVAYQR